jgi:hypothetical protein
MQVTKLSTRIWFTMAIVIWICTSKNWRASTPLCSYVWWAQTLIYCSPIFLVIYIVFMASCAEDIRHEVRICLHHAKLPLANVCMYPCCIYKLRWKKLSSGCSRGASYICMLRLAIWIWFILFLYTCRMTPTFHSLRPSTSIQLHTLLASYSYILFF